MLKFCVKILFCRHYFSPLNTFMRKGKDPEPDPGGPKTCGSCGSGSGSGSPTLLQTFLILFLNMFLQRLTIYAGGLMCDLARWGRGTPALLQQICQKREREQQQPSQKQQHLHHHGLQHQDVTIKVRQLAE